jgi:hypothetical protein
MLNNTTRVSVSNHVNAVSGNIIKTYKESYFKRFHLNSRLSDDFFKENSDVVVIQMMVCGDMEVIAEIMLKEKYNKLIDEMKDNQ